MALLCISVLLVLLLANERTTTATVDPSKSLSNRRVGLLRPTRISIVGKPNFEPTLKAGNKDVLKHDFAVHGENPCQPEISPLCQRVPHALQSTKKRAGRFSATDASGRLLDAAVERFLLVKSNPASNEPKPVVVVAIPPVYKGLKITDGGSYDVPDQALCIGSIYIVEGVNNAFGFFNKSTGYLIQKMSISTLLDGEQNKNPVCIYDAKSSMFYIAAMMKNNSIHMAVIPDMWDLASTTYPVYKFQYSLPHDSPQIGQDAYSVWITTDVLNDNGSFNGTFFLGLNKRQLAAGETAETLTFDDPKYTAPGATASGLNCQLLSVVPQKLQPGNSADMSNNGTMYFLSRSNLTSNEVIVSAITGTSNFATAADDLISKSIVSTALDAFAVPNLVGPNNRVVTSGISYRMQDAAYAAGKLYGVSMTKSPKTAGIAIALHIIQPTVSGGQLSLTMIKSDTISDATSNNSLAFPSLGVDPNGAGIIAFSYMGPTTYPAVAYVGLYDNGSYTNASIVAQDTAAIGVIESGRRWGEYSASQYDAFTGRVYFATHTAKENWTTYIGYATPPPQTSSPDKLPASLARTPTSPPPPTSPTPTPPLPGPPPLSESPPPPSSPPPPFPPHSISPPPLNTPAAAAPPSPDSTASPISSPATPPGVDTTQNTSPDPESPPSPPPPSAPPPSSNSTPSPPPPDLSPPASAPDSLESLALTQPSPPPVSTPAPPPSPPLDAGTSSRPPFEVPSFPPPAPDPPPPPPPPDPPSPSPSPPPDVSHPSSLFQQRVLPSPPPELPPPPPALTPTAPPQPKPQPASVPQDSPPPLSPPPPSPPPDVKTPPPSPRLPADPPVPTDLPGNPAPISPPPPRPLYPLLPTNPPGAPAPNPAPSTSPPPPPPPPPEPPNLPPPPPLPPALPPPPHQPILPQPPLQASNSTTPEQPPPPSPPPDKGPLLNDTSVISISALNLPPPAPPPKPPGSPPPKPRPSPPPPMRLKSPKNPQVTKAFQSSVRTVLLAIKRGGRHR